MRNTRTPIILVSATIARRMVKPCAVQVFRWCRAVARDAIHLPVSTREIVSDLADAWRESATR